MLFLWSFPLCFTCNPCLPYCPSLSLSHYLPISPRHCLWLQTCRDIIWGGGRKVLCFHFLFIVLGNFNTTILSEHNRERVEHTLLWNQSPDFLAGKWLCGTRQISSPRSLLSLLCNRDTTNNQKICENKMRKFTHNSLNCHNKFVR